MASSPTSPLAYIVTFLPSGRVEESFYIDAATQDEAVERALKLSGNSRSELTGVVRAGPKPGA